MKAGNGFHRDPCRKRNCPEAFPPSGAVVHMIGICGTGMAAVAGLLLERGYRVRGSDTQAYPPMGDLLARLGIPVAIGYAAENLAPDPDLIIIGNVIRASNPEAIAAMDRGLPCLSFPEAVSLLFLRERTSLVVAGTHGKTTTSGLLVSVLESAGADPGFLVGGVLAERGTGFHAGSPPWFVLEGDEYDTAFFDKGPKFLHYRPHGVIITSIEFDHADIYADLAAIEDAFRRLVRIIPEDGVIVACADWPSVREVCGTARCRVVTYGESPDAAWRLSRYEVGADGTVLDAMTPDGSIEGLRIGLPGRHNALNALGVLALAARYGLSVDAVRAGLAAFAGVRRRQEVRGEVNGVTVIDDFAHHPTAVRETLDALRAKYGKRRIVAVFEPRTNTSRRAVFQDAYPASFLSADRIHVREVPDPEKAPPEDRFSSRRLVLDLNAMGKAAIWHADAASILEALLPDARPGDVIAVLSNGAFEGIHDRILAGLKGEEG